MVCPGPAPFPAAACATLRPGIDRVAPAPAFMDPMTNPDTEPRPDPPSAGRPRIGLYEATGNRDGMWRYADVPLSGAAARAVEVILLNRRSGVHDRHPGT